MKNTSHGKSIMLADIAARLHGDRNGPWINVAGPGHSNADRSLGILFDPNAPDRFRIRSLADDDPQECRAHVKKLLAAIDPGFAVGQIDVVVLGAAAGAQQKTAPALKMWDDAKPIKGTPAETYLNGRGCPVTADKAQTDVLRFSAAGPFGPRAVVPTMIALMVDAVTGMPTGIHRTALRDDGKGKREVPDGGPSRKMLGRAKGSVVRLGHAAPRMGIAEGIETAMSASSIFKVPVWSALSANGVADFPIVNGIQFLSILADHDEAGISAARECARRYKKAGIEVEVRCPPKQGTDWNDYIREIASGCDHKEADGE